MPVPATIHAKEIDRIARQSYINRQFKVALIDAPGTDFGSDDSFNYIMTGEVLQGLGGYERQQIGFTSADLGMYEDGKMPLARKAASFVHNNSVNQQIRFSHVAVLNPDQDNIVAITRLASRATLTDGQTAVFYFDFNLYGVFIAA